MLLTWRFISAITTTHFLSVDSIVDTCKTLRCKYVFSCLDELHFPSFKKVASLAHLYMNIF